MSFGESERPWKRQRCATNLESTETDKALGTDAVPIDGDERQDRARLEKEQWQNQSRFRHRMEDIFQRYSVDLGEEADEINIRTGELLVDRGHWKALPDAESEEEYESFTSDEDGIMDDHDEDILDFLQKPAEDAPNWLEESKDNSRAQTPALWRPEDDLKPLARLGTKDLPSEETILRQFGSAGPAVLEVLRKQAADHETVPITDQQDQAADSICEILVDEDDDDLSVLTCESPMTKTPLRLMILPESLRKTSLLASASPTKTSSAATLPVSSSIERHDGPILPMHRSSKASGRKELPSLGSLHKSSPLRVTLGEVPTKNQPGRRMERRSPEIVLDECEVAAVSATSRTAAALRAFDEALSPRKALDTVCKPIAKPDIGSSIEKSQFASEKTIITEEISSLKEVTEQEAGDAEQIEPNSTTLAQAGCSTDGTTHAPRKNRKKPPRLVNATDYPTGMPDRPYYCPLPRCVKKFKSKFGFERHYDAAGAVCKFGGKRIRKPWKRKSRRKPAETAASEMNSETTSKTTPKPVKTSAAPQAQSSTRDIPTATSKPQASTSDKPTAAPKVKSSTRDIPKAAPKVQSTTRKDTTNDKADNRAISVLSNTNPVLERRGHSSSPEPLGPLQRKRRQLARQASDMTPERTSNIASKRTTRTSTGTLTTLPSYRIKGLREYLKDDVMYLQKTSPKKRLMAAARQVATEVQAGNAAAQKNGVTHSSAKELSKVQNDHGTHDDQDDSRMIRAWKKRRATSYHSRDGGNSTSRQGIHHPAPSQMAYNYCPPEYPIDKIYAQYVGNVQKNVDYNPQYYQYQTGWPPILNATQDGRGHQPNVSQAQSDGATLSDQRQESRSGVPSEVPDSDLGSSQTEWNYWPREATKVPRGPAAKIIL